MRQNCLVLTQSRKSSEYNDFVGRFYHFPNKYLSQFNSLPAEFVYYEPTEIGNGVFFGYGKIKSAPAEDKREPGHYFVAVSDYKPFLEPVPFKDESGKFREADSPYYNAQHSVRKIPLELLDEICLDGKIRLNFTADAHLIKVLGEQLIGSEKVGILELIKNSYDAGASRCRVRIESLPSLPSVDKDEYLFPQLPGPVIIIEDDGIGMTRDVIENGWLRPASTIKTVVKENMKLAREKAAKLGKLAPYEKLISEIKRERGGRIPLGEKGVGRFAAHRLGNHLLVKTKVSDKSYEYVLDVDWDKFNAEVDEPRDLETVGISLSRQKPSRDYGKKGSGTQLIIYGGREGFVWDREAVDDIHRSIASLNSPNPSPRESEAVPGFSAYLECPQVSDLPSDNPLGFFAPTFSFDGLINEDGVLEYSLKFQPPKTVPMPAEEFEEKAFDLRKVQAGYWVQDSGAVFRSPECGPFYLHIDIWYRRDPWIGTTGPDGTSFIDYLTQFGGISIFRDGINIFPAEWGAETDWLHLSKKHIKQGWRMSYYNMIGNVELDQSRNIGLVDKTNREGLIENRPFKDLTQLVNAIIAIIETKFIGKRDEYNALTGDVVRDPKLLSEYAKQGAALIRDIKERYPLEEDPFKILNPIGPVHERGERLLNLGNSLKNLQKSVDLMQEARDLLTEQAGYGMAVAVSVHEIAKIAANFYMGVSQLLKLKEPDLRKLRALKEASASLQSELKRLGPLRAVKTETQTEFDIIKPIRYVIELFRVRLEKAGIEVKVNAGEPFEVYGRYGALIQIFSNLFDNSCYWLGTAPRPNRKITIRVDSKNRTVTIADSGPGVDEAIRPYLFQPGYSMRIPPSGLGLHICKYYMQSMKGDAYLTSGREKLSGLAGAQFTLDFDRVPSERRIDKK
jgi:signal transduction histidine kinase